MDILLQALSDTLSPMILGLVFGGVFLGIIIGALPGLSATMGVAILLPFTYYLSPAEGMALLLGIYTGGIYGGSIPAILLNIPGCPASLMTTLDGYPMSCKGQGGRAIGIATVSSFIGGLVGVLALCLLGPALAKFALSFSPEAYASLAFLGLSAIVVVVSDSIIKGFISVFIGLLLGTVGMDPIVSVQRFTFGSVDLLTGINYVPVIIGLFGLAEVFTQAVAPSAGQQGGAPLTNILPGRADLKTIFRNALHPCWIGTAIGALPGAGGTIASIISYNRAKAASRCPENFGTGIPEGIVASEVANNASIGGSLVPLLTLGIPGSAAAAVLLGALMMHDLQPGPNLFVSDGRLVNTIFGILIMANVAMLALGLLSARIFPKIIQLPRSALLPFITLLCVMGSYALNNSVFEVCIMLAAGIAGFFLKGFGVSAGPIILGLILGPLVEANFRAALELSDGDISIFVKDPLSAAILGITCALIAFPLVKNVVRKRKAAGRQ